jgi:hypothetical protein
MEIQIMVQKFSWLKISQLLTIIVILNWSFSILYNSMALNSDLTWKTPLILWLLCFYSFGFVALEIPIQKAIHVMVFIDCLNCLFSFCEVLRLLDTKATLPLCFFVIFEFMIWCLHLMSLVAYVNSDFQSRNMTRLNPLQERIAPVDELPLYKLKDPTAPPPYFAHGQDAINQVGPSNREPHI